MKISNLLKPAVVAAVLSLAVVSCSNDHNDVSTEEVEAVEGVSDNNLLPEIDSKMFGVLLRELPKCPRTVKVAALSPKAARQAKIAIGPSLKATDKLCKNGKKIIRSK